MSARSPRYAVLDRRPSGLNRELRNLRWLLADAHLSGRVAEVPEPDGELARATLPASWRCGAYGARAWSQALRARRALRRRPGGARDG